MGLKFIDSFAGYATADLIKRYLPESIGQSIQPTAGRRGGPALRLSSSNSSVQKMFTSHASWVVGFGLKVANVPALAAIGATLIAFLDGTSSQAVVILHPDGTLSMARGAPGGSTAVTGGRSTNSLLSDAFYFIEAKITIADSVSAGSCKIRVNGVDWVTVATGQDLKVSTNASASIVKIGGSGLSSEATFCDLYICDGSGSTANDFLGDVRAEILLPNADGTYSDFTPSTGTTHYTLVDESAPNTTDYVSSSTAGHRDTYDMGNLTPLVSQVIYGVQVTAACIKSDSGPRTVAPILVSGGVVAEGTEVAPSQGSQVLVSSVFELNPNGSVAFTESAVNATEAGLKVVT